MIIGKELSKVLDGLEINLENGCRVVQNSYGKQDDLDKFISECDKVQAQKFPLIFYVTDKVQDFGSSVVCKTNIVIMTNTNTNWLSKKRTSETFDKIIQPIYNKLIPAIRKAKGFSIKQEVGEALIYEDIANYGIVKGGVGSKTSEKSVVSDFIDARVINIELQFKNNNC